MKHVFVSNLYIKTDLSQIQASDTFILLLHGLKYRSKSQSSQKYSTASSGIRRENEEIIK